MIKETMQVYDEDKRIENVNSRCYNENRRIEKEIKKAKRNNRKSNVLMRSWKMPMDIINFFKSFSNGSQALWIIIRESKAYNQWVNKNSKKL